VRQIKERRLHSRSIAKGLIILIDDQVCPVIDISVSGVSFQASLNSIGSRVRVKLARLTDKNDCIACEITVRAVSGAITHAEFSATMPLMHYIIGHIGKVTGAEPAFFR